jgi:hypothetical protein
MAGDDDPQGIEREIEAAEHERRRLDDAGEPERRRLEDAEEPEQELDAVRRALRRHDDELGPPDRDA